MFFFPIFFFNNVGGIPIILATQFLNGAGAITDTNIIQFFFFFFQNMRTQDISKIIFAVTWVKLHMVIGATRPREIQK